MQPHHNKYCCLIDIIFEVPLVQHKTLHKVTNSLMLCIICSGLFVAYLLFQNQSYFNFSEHLNVNYVNSFIFFCNTSNSLNKFILSLILLNQFCLISSKCKVICQIISKIRRNLIKVKVYYSKF